VIVDTLSDNRNRAVSEIRFAFSKNGGNLGETGSVGYLFSKKGVIVVAKSAADEDKLTEIVLDAGADDLTDEGENWEILTSPKDYETVMAALTAAKIKPEHAEVTMISSTYTKLEGTQAAQMMRLLDAIDDLDDTQAVYSNFDMDEESVPA
jgi:YebC/PmpR family DNA-binding regulatory protein